VKQMKSLLNRGQIRRITELRAQERAIKSMFSLSLEDSVFVEFLEFARHNFARSNSRHFTDLVAAFFLGTSKRFLEIGAARPEDSSDTNMLENFFHWTGVQIEPNPDFARQLKDGRRSVVVNAALVGEARSDRSLYLNRDLGTLNAKRGLEVPTITLGQLVDQYGSNFQACFIDIEGGEPEIVNDEVFSQISFDFIAIERIWNYPLIQNRLESLGFRNIFSEVSGYESWWLHRRLLEHSVNTAPR
jgi:hypothetical protein